jgi:hypothetical protein
MYEHNKSYSVDPVEAAKILKLNSFERQRPVRKHVVRFYAEEMLQGNWLPDRPIEFAKWNDRLFMIDGQHRMYAVIESGTAQRFAILVHTVNSEEELALRYIKTDRNLRRDDSDALRAIALDCEFGLPTSKLSRYGAAIKFIASGFIGTKKMHTEEYIDSLRFHAKGIEAYEDMLMDFVQSGNPISRRAPVASVGIVTLMESVKVYGEQKVLDFWEGTLTALGFTSLDDPRKRIHSHLTETSLIGGAGTRMTKNAEYATRNYQARAVAACFNAWVEDRTLNKIQVRDPMARIMIRGSRFKGK